MDLRVHERSVATAYGRDAASAIAPRLSSARSALKSVRWTDLPGEAGRASRQKKGPLRRAAKFREETPRKGGGIAIRERNAALQQYDGTSVFVQGAKQGYFRQNAAETLGKYIIIANILAELPVSAA